MNVFLAGGTGFIGGHAARALVGRGHMVTCLARDTTSGRARWLAGLPGVTLIEGAWTRPETWRHYVAGHDAVVNGVGIIRETRGASFDAVHTAAPIALFEEAARAGVRKVVQVSALGADDSAASRFHLSKRAADRWLAEQRATGRGAPERGVPYVVLRPSIVYGPDDHSMTFFARLALLPVTPVPGDGQYRVQPLHVADLTRAIADAVERDSLSALTVDVGGANVLSFDTLLDLLARHHGDRASARTLHVPWTIMGVVARATDLLGGHGPITSDELGMLRRGNTCDNRPFIAHFDFAPRSLEEGMAPNRHRWSARRFFA